MSARVKLLLAAIMLVAALVLFLRNSRKDEAEIFAYEAYLGQQLGELLIELNPEVSSILILEPNDSPVSQTMSSRIEGVIKSLPYRTCHRQKVVIDPLKAQTGGDVFPPERFLDVIRLNPQAEAVISLVGPPTYSRKLEQGWSERHPLVVVLAVYDEAVEPLLARGIVDAAIVPAAPDPEKTYLGASPYEGRFRREYRIVHAYGTVE